MLREATGTDGSRHLLIGHLDDLRQRVAATMADPDLNEQRVSYSALRVLGIFGMFAPAGAVLGVKDVAEEFGISPGTAHRYVRTLTQVGLLEQIPHGRKYRIPPAIVQAGAPED